MSSVFQDITLSWKDKKYVIPADRVLPALARVEEAITLHELEQFQRRGTVPIARLSQAYGMLLRFAGCSATDDEVYQGVLTHKDFDVGGAVTGLLLMMLPPFPTEGATPSGNVSKAGGKSFRQRIKSPSAT